jgi:hypothetical protein
MLEISNELEERQLAEQQRQKQEKKEKKRLRKLADEAAAREVNEEEKRVAEVPAVVSDVAEATVNVDAPVEDLAIAMNEMAVASNKHSKKGQGGMFVANEEASKKAEELALQRASAHRFERCKALFERYLVDEESALATTISEGDYYMSRAECQTYHREYHHKAKDTSLGDPTKFIRSQRDVDSYFKDVNGAHVRTFKVVVETPTQDKARTDFYIQVYFLQKHEIVKVKFLTVIDFLDDLQKVVLVAFMRQNYSLATKEEHEIDARHLAFCEAVGDNPLARTAAQEQER